jgi:GNAT superfamily N-acetyltransferase
MTAAKRILITTLEEISLNAFPALQTVLYDGWILRFANGYSRRANSVQPLYVPTQPLDEKIAYCEKLYRAQNLPVVFKMTRAAQPAPLDAKLELRGYSREADTIVQTCELAPHNALRVHAVEICEAWREEWFDAFCRMNNPNPAHRATRRQMLRWIVPQKGFAMLRENGVVRACGLGVCQEKYLGLFDIVVDQNFRQRGYGKRIVSQLMAWGKQNGAQTAYLQVIAHNTPALNLYAQLGFVDHYSYWYRVHL